MVTRDTLDEANVLPGDAGSADPPWTRLATPHGLEALAVPANHSGGLHDDEGTIPLQPESPKSHPEETILGLQTSPILRPSVDGQLLTQGGVLQSQGGPWHQRGPHESE